MDYPKIAEVMKARRKSLGLTQDETAKLADISRRTLSEFENVSGNRGVSLRNLLAIADVLGMNVSATNRTSGREGDE